PVTRSDFASKGIVLETPGIQDGLHYEHYELEAIQGDIIKLDERQSRLAMFFARAEDRIFFAGPDPGVGTGANLSIIDLATKATIDAAAAGSYGSTTATAQLDLQTATTALLSLSGIIGQIRTGLNVASLKQFQGALVVTVDVKNKIEGLLNPNTDSTLEDVIMAGLNKAFGSSAIFATNMLGATLDYNNQEISVVDGTTNAVLMAIQGDSFIEVRTSPLIDRKEEGAISGVNIVLEEKYVPIFKQPLANVYSATVANI
ncbi:hypothetical protein LCGC14_1257450, partial [marine sediment metagenome]